MTSFNFDADGNELVCVGGNYHLLLKSENGRKRNLGRVIIHNEVHWFISERDKEKHFYHNEKGWGFNHHLLVDLEDSNVKMLCVKCKDCVYWISITDALNKCTFLNFKKSGFELQCIVKEMFFQFKEI